MMWVIRWNKEKTEGIIWRLRDYPPYPTAPCIEGKIRQGTVLK